MATNAAETLWLLERPDHAQLKYDEDARVLSWVMNDCGRPPLVGETGPVMRPQCRRKWRRPRSTGRCIFGGPATSAVTTLLFPFLRAVSRSKDRGAVFGLLSKESHPVPSCPSV